jgi:3-oxoacyl-[acyl-carrier-protein] synthase-1
MSIANVMAGIPRKSRSQKIIDTKQRPVVLGIAKYLSQNLNLNTRFTGLLIPALAETMQILEGKKGISLKFLLGLPKPRPGLASTLISELEASLSKTTFKPDIKFNLEIIRRDHDSGLVAMTKAVEALQNGEVEFCLVGGVDSYVHQKTISWLEKEEQLICSSNNNGYTPGEAAALCLLCEEKIALKYQLPVLAKILGTATAEEPSVKQEDLPNTGKGLSQAINMVLKSLPENELIQETFCTLKGLRHEAMEYSFSIMTSSTLLEKPGSFSSFSLYWGDIGAASAPALMVYAIEKKSLGYSKGGHHLVFTQSPGSSRSAALLQVL